MQSLNPDFPFAALCAHARLQLALLLAAADPLVGGVLIEGPRGTAKTTAARSLGALLTLAAGATSAQNGVLRARGLEPQAQDLGAQSVVPFVNLPLSATLEQLAGTLDLGAALAGGGLRFQPGLLARAHGGVLYVDEVNLLPDALVDTLLDASASGVHRVERDGFSHEHPARFVLIGTMNPEEGPVRAQLLDRFGLHLRLGEPASAAERAAIVRTRLAFEADPVAFCAQHAPRQQALAVRLARARARLANAATAPVMMEAMYAHIAERVHAAQPQGLRADLVIVRAARALAALDDAPAVCEHHIQTVAALALSHRARQALPQPMPQLPQWLEEDAPQTTHLTLGATSAPSGTVTARGLGRDEGKSAQNAPSSAAVQEGTTVSPTSAQSAVLTARGFEGKDAQSTQNFIENDVKDAKTQEFLAQGGAGLRDAQDYALDFNPWAEVRSDTFKASSAMGADIGAGVGELPSELRAALEGAASKKAPRSV